MSPSTAPCLAHCRPGDRFIVTQSLGQRGGRLSCRADLYNGHRVGERHVKEQRNIEFSRLRQYVAVEERHSLGLEVEVVCGTDGVTGSPPEPIATFFGLVVYCSLL